MFIQLKFETIRKKLSKHPSNPHISCEMFEGKGVLINSVVSDAFEFILGKTKSRRNMTRNVMTRTTSIYQRTRNSKNASEDVYFIKLP